MRHLVPPCVHHLLTTYAEQPMLPIPAAKKFFNLVQAFLKKWSMLARQADSDADLLWSEVPKHHYYFHLGQRSMYLNPRRGNCMIDEDYVGSIKYVVAEPPD